MPPRIPRRGSAPELTMSVSFTSRRGSVGQLKLPSAATPSAGGADEGRREYQSRSAADPSKPAQAAWGSKDEGGREDLRLAYALRRGLRPLCLAVLAVLASTTLLLPTPLRAVQETAAFCSVLVACQLICSVCVTSVSLVINDKYLSGTARGSNAKSTAATTTAATLDMSKGRRSGSRLSKSESHSIVSGATELRVLSPRTRTDQHPEQSFDTEMERENKSLVEGHESKDFKEGLDVKAADERERVKGINRRAASHNLRLSPVRSPSNFSRARSGSFKELKEFKLEARRSHLVLHEQFSKHACSLLSFPLATSVFFTCPLCTRLRKLHLNTKWGTGKSMGINQNQNHPLPIGIQQSEPPRYYQARRTIFRRVLR